MSNPAETLYNEIKQSGESVMKTYTFVNTERWGIKEYNEFSHPDYEHPIMTTQAYKGGYFEITPHSAEEEEKLLNWPVGEDLILEKYDWAPVEFFDSDIEGLSLMDDDMLETIEEETDYFWGLPEAGWESDSCETIVEEGKFELVENL